MSTLAAFARPVAVAALGAAAFFAAPAAASAAPFMPEPLANCKPAATLDVEKEGNQVEWEFEGPKEATTDAQVTYLNIGGPAPTLGTSGPLTNGEGVERELPGFTGHLIPGGTYDPDGPNGPLEACTLGFGFAVTQ
ncbi:hypothetical protein GXW84_30340 [Rhodococcus sp. IEGM 248]|uniref:hypothetical protein n=1 Tax=Rhodococcus opacus TaxID=37919 RepID=UPI0013BF5934|nr:hypothetical protein [Rhodococcus opacus]MDV7083197.1 hypothetical protein [Rhodococcus opacus]NDV08732.1 hypothetical protein [Rhodococcus sp. IEGM 248]